MGQTAGGPTSAAAHLFERFLSRQANLSRSSSATHDRQLRTVNRQRIEIPEFPRQALSRTTLAMVPPQPLLAPCIKRPSRERSSRVAHDVEQKRHIVQRQQP